MAANSEDPIQTGLTKRRGVVDPVWKERLDEITEESRGLKAEAVSATAAATAALGFSSVLEAE